MDAERGDPVGDSERARAGRAEMSPGPTEGAVRGVRLGPVEAVWVEV